MKPDPSLKRLVAPAAVLIAASVSFVGSLGCTTEMFSSATRYKPPMEEYDREAQAAKEAADKAAKDAVTEGVQQDITSQITNGQMGNGDF